MIINSRYVDCTIMIHVRVPSRITAKGNPLQIVSRLGFKKFFRNVHQIESGPLVNKRAAEGFTLWAGDISVLLVLWRR